MEYKMIEGFEKIQAFRCKKCGAIVVDCGSHKVACPANVNMTKYVSTTKRDYKIFI